MLDDWQDLGYHLVKIAVAKVVHQCTDHQFFGEDMPNDTRSEVTEILQKNGINLREFGITERARSPAFRLFKGAS